MGNIADGIKGYGTQQIQKDNEESYLQSLLDGTTEFASDFDEGAQNLASSILPEGWVDPYTPTVAETPEEAAYLDKLRVQFPDKTDEELLSPSFGNTVNKFAQSATTVAGNMASGAHRLLSTDTSIANALAAEFAEQNYTALPTNIPFAPGDTYSQTGVEQPKPDFQGIQDEYNALASKDYEDFTDEEKQFWNSEAGNKLHDINKDVQKYKHVHENIERFKTSMDEYVVRTVEDYRADEKFSETYKNSGGGVTGTLAGMLEMVSDNPELAPVSFIENLPYMLAFAYGGAATKVTLIAAKDEENLAKFKEQKGREPTLKERARITVDSVGSVLMESFGDRYVLRGKARGVFSKIDKILPPGLTRVIGSTGTETISGAGSEAFDQDARLQDLSKLNYEIIANSAAREGITGAGGGGGAAAKNFAVDTLTSEESKLATAINQQVDTTYTNQDATGAFNQANIDAQINPNQITPPTTTAEDAQATREAYLKSIVQADEEADSRMYHGSGDGNIEQFSTDRVGQQTANAGYMPVWGNFFTNDEKIANWYENQGKDFNKYSELHGAQQEIRHQLERLPEVANQRGQDPMMGAWDVKTSNPDTQALVDEYKRLGNEIDGLSRTYRVENGAKESEMLNWDNPLKTQSETVEMGAYKLINGNPSLQNRMEAVFGARWAENATGNDVYTGLTNIGLEKGLSKQEAQKEASLALNSVGIKGVKYEDVTKVGKWKAASKNPQNYVLFNDEDATIQNPRNKAQQQNDYIKDTLINKEDKAEPKYQTAEQTQASASLTNNEAAVVNADKTLTETDAEWNTRVRDYLEGTYRKTAGGTYVQAQDEKGMPWKDFQPFQEEQKKLAYDKLNEARDLALGLTEQRDAMEGVDPNADAAKHELDMNVPEDKFQDGRITNPEPMKANAALKEVMSKLPYAKYVDFQQVEQILKPNGEKAFGVFINDMVKHVENIDRTTLPHESFHHFLKFATTEEHRRSLFDIIRKREGNANKSVVDIEEIMTQEVSEVFVGKTKREVETPLKKFYLWIKDLVQAHKRDGFKDSIELRRQYREFMSEDAKPLGNIVQSTPDTAYINEAKAAYQKSPREFTTKMIKFLEKSMGEEATFSHLENMIKGGSKQVTNRDKALIKHVLSLPQYKKMAGTKEKVKIADIIGEMEKELLDFSIIKSVQTYNGSPIGEYGLSNIGRDDLRHSSAETKAETLLINTNFEHGVVGHFPEDFDSMVWKDDLEVRRISAVQQQDAAPGMQGAKDQYHVVLKTLNNDNITDGGVRASFPTKEDAQTYIDNFEGEREDKAGMYGHIRTMLETETYKNTTRKVSYLTEAQSDPHQGVGKNKKYQEKIIRSNEQLRKIEEKELQRLGKQATATGGQSLERRMLGVTDDTRKEAETIGTFNTYKKGKKHIVDTLQSVKSIKEKIESGQAIPEDALLYETRGGFEGEYDYMDKALHYISESVEEHARFKSGKISPDAVVYKEVQRRVERGLLDVINERMAHLNKFEFTRNENDPAVLAGKAPMQVTTAKDLDGFIEILDTFLENQDIRIGQAAKGLGAIGSRLDAKYAKEGNYYRKSIEKDTANVRHMLNAFTDPENTLDSFRIARANLLIDPDLGGARTNTDSSTLSEPASKLYKTLVHTLPQVEYSIKKKLSSNNKEMLVLVAAPPEGYKSPKDIPLSKSFDVMTRENTPEGRRQLESWSDKRIKQGAPVVGTAPEYWSVGVLTPYAKLFEDALQELENTAVGELTPEQAKEIRKSDQFLGFTDKNYELLIDTYIRDSWIKGAEVARFPTAHTLSLIEGYTTEDDSTSMRMAEEDANVGMPGRTHLGGQGIISRKEATVYDDDGNIEQAGNYDIIIGTDDGGSVREFKYDDYVKGMVTDYEDGFETLADADEFHSKIQHSLAYHLSADDYLVAETELINTAPMELLDSANEDIREAAEEARVEMVHEYRNSDAVNDMLRNLNRNYPGSGNNGWEVYTYEGDEYIVVNEDPHYGVRTISNETFSNKQDANAGFELGQIENTNGYRDIAHRYAEHTNDKSIDKINEGIREKNVKRIKRGQTTQPEVSKKGAIYKYIEKIRPDLHKVTDDKGYTWYETKITDADGDAVMLFQTQDKITESQEKKADELGKEALKAKPLERHQTGMIDQMSNDDIALVGGMRSGNSKGDETRRMYTLYDMKNMDEDFANAQDQEIGNIQLFTEDATDKIRGIVDIKIPTSKRKQGHARKAIESLVASEFSNKPFKIYDIKKSAYPFWKKMGVVFTNYDFSRETKDISKRHKRKGDWGTVNGFIGSEADVKKEMKGSYLNDLIEETVRAGDLTTDGLVGQTPTKDQRNSYDFINNDERAYTNDEFNKVGESVRDDLALSAHKFRGLTGFQSKPGDFSHVSDSDFIELMDEDPEIFDLYGFESLDEAENMLRDSVGLDRLKDMMGNSRVELTRPLYIVRSKFMGGDGKSAVEVREGSLYSAQVVDPNSPYFKKFEPMYGKNAHVIKLEKGTKVYHPSDSADAAEVVVEGVDISKSQQWELEDFKKVEKDGYF